MPRHLIRHIDPWSVAKTVFPLVWILGTVGIMLIYAIAGSMIMRLAGQFYDAPMSTGPIGFVALLIASLFTGFIYSLVATVFVTLGAVGYNFLTDLGGGFEVDLETIDSPIDAEGPEMSGGLPQSVEIIPQAIPLDGEVKETEEREPSDDGGTA